MDKIRNLSLRKTIVLYMVVSLIVCFYLSVVIIGCAESVQEEIWWKYVDKEMYYEMAEGKGIEYMTDIPRPNSSEMTRSDYRISELCDFLQTFTVLIVSVLGSVAAVFLFYKNKLKNPIEELEAASQKIGKDDLAFHITYENRDEMGTLCREFERMREQLAGNNKKLWQMIEEEKALRAAIAHDIRSPLTVLKGYQEMLQEYLPSENAEKSKVMEMLSESEKQIERMDHFVETMRKMNSLEGRKLVAKEMTGEQLKKEIQAEIDILERKSGKNCKLILKENRGCFHGDRAVLLEVTENLLSNAFRYAEEQIAIDLSVTTEEVQICIKDDGSGFGEHLEEVTKPFYRQNVKDSLKHAGLGMYLSRLYCEKHGGRLFLENGEKRGAVTTAVFHRIA